MQETIQVLLGLQELDTNLFSVKDELRRLPAERERRRKAIDARIATRDLLDEEVQRLQAGIKEVEMDTTIRRQRQRKLDNQLSDATDAALIASFQHEIRELKRYISQAEEEALESVAKVEELAEKRLAVAAEIEEEEVHFAEFEENMKKEMADAEKRRAALEADRDKRLTGNLDRNVLDVYERLLDAREGMSLSMLDGRTCTACYMEVPQNLYVRIARAADLVLCPSCGRILYLPKA
ncbi:MAG: C4-type zinc ribbon domain-containing protein [Planctomycetota bacterium]|nr:C4-type zinc ribbon domain-containing protein [Planctomycetota bacterium]